MNSPSALTPRDSRMRCCALEEPMASQLKTCKRASGLVLGEDAYSFTPSWQLIPRADIVPFLVSLPSPGTVGPHDDAWCCCIDTA